MSDVKRIPTSYWQINNFKEILEVLLKNSLVSHQTIKEILPILQNFQVKKLRLLTGANSNFYSKCKSYDRAMRPTLR